MAKYKEDYLVQCPYYREEAPQTLHCEGVTEGSCLQLGFSSRPRMHAYKARYCRACWKTCPVAGMLNRKYDYQP